MSYCVCFGCKDVSDNSHYLLTVIKLCVDVTTDKTVRLSDPDYELNVRFVLGKAGRCINVAPGVREMTTPLKRAGGYDGVIF